METLGSQVQGTLAAHVEDVGARESAPRKGVGVLVTSTQPSTALTTILVCGIPGDGTMIIADWLVLAARLDGLQATAVPLCGAADRPHGMTVTVSQPSGLGDHGASVPAGPADIVISGEHMELMRALKHGWIRSQTTVITSSTRSITAFERAIDPTHVVSESEVDQAMRDATAAYIAFDGRQVAGWYRMSRSLQCALLFGAATNTGALPVSTDSCALAIRQLGIQPIEHLQAFAKGSRFGTTRGGRVRRTLTASQFIRKRRAQVTRSDRVQFTELVTRAERELSSEHHPAAFEFIFQMTTFISVAYAETGFNMVLEIAREEDTKLATQQLRVCPADSIVPVVIRNLSRMLVYVDEPRIAQRLLSRGMLAGLRRNHGLSDTTAFDIELGVPAAEVGMPVQWVKPLSLSGLVWMHRRRMNATRREGTPGHATSLDVARAYVSVLRQALDTADTALVAIVANSGFLVSGSGAVRDAAIHSAHTFWGSIVSPALAIDRNHAPDSHGFTAIIVPHVYTAICQSGPLALWEFTGQVLGIAMQVSRGATWETAMQYAHSLCLRRPLPEME